MRFLISTGLLIVLAAGCGGAHMSEGYGKRSRAAFAAQAQNKTQEPIAPLDAADAKIVLDAHRKVEDTGPQAVPPLAPASL